MRHYNSFHDNDQWSPCHTTATLPLTLCVYIATYVQLTSTFSCCSSSSADFALHSSCNCYVEVRTYICTVRVIKFEELKFCDFIFSWHSLITLSQCTYIKYGNFHGYNTYEIHENLNPTKINTHTVYRYAHKMYINLKCNLSLVHKIRTLLYVHTYVSNMLKHKYNFILDTEYSSVPTH